MSNNLNGRVTRLEQTSAARRRRAYILRRAAMTPEERAARQTAVIAKLRAAVASGQVDIAQIRQRWPSLARVHFETPGQD